MEFINEEIKKYHEEYIKLLNEWTKALDKFNNANIFNEIKLQKNSEKAEKNFSEYSKNIYAKKIFDTYSKIKPTLIRIRTLKKYTWDEIFKDNFEKLDNLDKSILVSLVENNGGYKLEINN